MSNKQQFFDHFAVANLSLQERLGRSGAALNKDSAVFGQQVRSLLQMLTFGLDAVTARSASHLLNMDLFYSNDAYLLKLTEGVLLNSVRSVTPPKINAATPFRFWSERSYERWSSLGSISLKDGTKASIIAYKVCSTGKVEGDDNGVEYEALYCAGNYVQQHIDSGFDGYTPGIFAPIYLGEIYKSIWAESVEVRLEMNGRAPIPLKLAWSMDELLSMPDTSNAALVMNTPRGLTITLGDGEIFGEGYNDPDKSGIKSVLVTYVKCDSLAPVDHSTLKFNKDITEININGESVPLLTPLDTGDTANTLRSRSIAEFFAASKITDERDLQTELMKIPYVKSVGVRREYNWSVWKTVAMLAAGRTAPAGSPEALFYKRYQYSAGKTYTPGELVVKGNDVWICTDPHYRGAPSAKNGWTFFISLANGSAIGAMYERYYPSACVYDNATIVLSGLVMKSRRYWNENSHYSRGDVVYHSKTKQLWLALKDGGELVEPGSEDVNIYGDDGTTLQRYWATREEAEILEDGSNRGVNDPFANVGYKFDDYEQITQAMFEAELKGYFNIAGKLGFTSVVVEPLAQVGVVVSCKYKAPYTMQQNIRKFIEDYVCYNVNKSLRADDLNSQLTSKFNLSAVYVNISFAGSSKNTDVELVLPVATYVPPSLLEIELKETL